MSETSASPAPSPTAPGAPRRLPALAWAIVVLVLGGLVALAALRPGGPRRTERTGILPVLFDPVPDVPADTHTGASTTTASLRGSWVLTGFIFTNCAGTCPRITEQMKRAAEALERDRGFRLASFTVDPDNDLPKVLRAYAGRNGADRPNWTFFWTTAADLQRVVAEGCKLSNDPQRPVLHTSSVVLLDPAGRPRGKYEPLEDPEWLEVLVSDLDRLRESAAAEPAPER